MLKCFKHNNVNWYLENRNKKYFNINLTNFDKSYFNEWLSGFIEAEGCFSIKISSNNHSFSIGQKNDLYLLNLIKSQFNIPNKIRNTKNKFWLIEVYRKSILLEIINHCTKFPLIGNKKISFFKFKDLFK